MTLSIFPSVTYPYWRAVTTERSSLAKGTYGVYFRRAPCWNITSKHGDSDEKNGDAHKRQRIRGPDAVKEAHHQVRHDQRHNKPNCGASSGSVQALTQDDPQDALALSAKREANADLACALAYHVRNDSVNSKACEKPGGQTE